jgi:hypothetical protein
MSLEVPAFSALLESANGVEAQPAKVDVAVTNKVAARIQTAFAFSAIGIPLSTLVPCTLQDALQYHQRIRLLMIRQLVNVRSGATTLVPSLWSKSHR